MIGIEWDVAASLTTVRGTLNFNVFPGLILDPNNCSATKTIRAAVDPIPQGDGDILHRRFLTGYTYKLTCQAFDTSSSASCLGDARQLFEELGLHLSAMLRDPGRYCWQPSGYSDKRALDQTFWLEGVTQNFATGGIWQASFSFDSPYPYAIDLFENTTTISGFGSITLAGNTDFYPVIRVHGPVPKGNNFVIGNATTGQAITYDTNLPGALPLAGGDYAEISTFNGTIYKNGNQDDLSAGIDPTLSNFDPALILTTGFNSLISTGASSDWLWNNPWA